MGRSNIINVNNYYFFKLVDKPEYRDQFLNVFLQRINLSRVDSDNPRNLEFGLLLWTENDSGLPTGPLTFSKTLLKHVFDSLDSLDAFMSSFLLLRLLKLSFIMSSLNLVDYPMFSLLLSTWNDLGHLPDTQGY